MNLAFRPESLDYRNEVVAELQQLLAKLAIENARRRSPGATKVVVTKDDFISSLPRAMEELGRRQAVQR